jgi:hypothetical protein
MTTDPVNEAESMSVTRVLVPFVKWLGVLIGGNLLLIVIARLLEHILWPTLELVPTVVSSAKFGIRFGLGAAFASWISTRILNGHRMIHVFLVGLPLPIFLFVAAPSLPEYLPRWVPLLLIAFTVSGGYLGVVAFHGRRMHTGTPQNGKSGNRGKSGTVSN